MAVNGPGPGREPAQWLPACKVTALLPARSARPGGSAASDTPTLSAGLPVSTEASAQPRRLIGDFADPLGGAAVPGCLGGGCWRFSRGLSWRRGWLDHAAQATPHHFLG